MSVDTLQSWIKFDIDFEVITPETITVIAE